MLMENLEVKTIENESKEQQTREHKAGEVDKKSTSPPEKAKLELDQQGQLYVVTASSVDGEKQELKEKVSLKRCFPWTHPMGHLSLRNDDGDEKAFVGELSELDEGSREALVLALQEVQFCFVITDLMSVKEDFELRTWQVKTKKGERTFQTKLTDWPREVPGGGLLIQDVYGDLYYVESPNDLPEPGRTQLWAFVD